jgi:thioredoxin 1
MIKLMEIKEKNFNKVIQNNKSVVVDFFGDGCYPCVQLEEIFKELEKKWKDYFLFTRLNTSKDENKGIAGHYQIEILPTIMFFYDGKVISFPETITKHGNKLVGLKTSGINFYDQVLDWLKTNLIKVKIKKKRKRRTYNYWLNYGKRKRR